MARKGAHLLQQSMAALRLAPPSAALVDPQRRLVTCSCLPLYNNTSRVQTSVLQFEGCG